MKQFKSQARLFHIKCFCIWKQFYIFRTFFHMKHSPLLIFKWNLFMLFLTKTFWSIWSLRCHPRFRLHCHPSQSPFARRQLPSLLPSSSLLPLVLPITVTLICHPCFCLPHRCHPHFCTNFFIWNNLNLRYVFFHMKCLHMKTLLHLLNIFSYETFSNDISLNFLLVIFPFFIWKYVTGYTIFLMK